MVTKQKLFILYPYLKNFYGNKNSFFTKSFSENQNWTFIFVHFSNYKKTFVDFIMFFLQKQNSKNNKTRK